MTTSQELLSGSDEEILENAYNQGLEFQAEGKTEEAIACFNKCLELDPMDHGGAAMRLAAMGAGVSPPKAPPAYVATLFDQHAEDFDDILVGQLEYRVPVILRGMFDDLGLARGFPRMLDLGCGTGLAGEAFEDICEELVAVDLSEEMVSIAAERGCYDDLYVADAVTFLQQTEETAFDLVIATDVMPYLGSLEDFMHALPQRLTAGGLVAFSTETQPEAYMAEDEWKVGPHHRFAHTEDYVSRALAGAGLVVENISPVVVRLEEGEPVPGQIFIACKAKEA
jgi:predicted TPR repeat methyltransferase